MTTFLCLFSFITMISLIISSCTITQYKLPSTTLYHTTTDEVYIFHEHAGLLFNTMMKSNFQHEKCYHYKPATTAVVFYTGSSLWWPYCYTNVDPLCHFYIWYHLLGFFTKNQTNQKYDTAHNKQWHMYTRKGLMTRPHTPKQLFPYSAHSLSNHNDTGYYDHPLWHRLLW